MLILTRKIGESIFIGTESDHYFTKITVSNINSEGVVFVGVEADNHVPIHREEIYNRLKSEGSTHIDTHNKKIMEEGG